MTRDDIAELSPNSIMLDGLDNSILGLVWEGDSFDDKLEPLARIAYSKRLIIKTMVERDEATLEEALESFDFNVQRTVDHLLWSEKTAPGAPIIVDDLEG